MARPVTGLSDNNDFSKVLGPANVCPGPFEDENTYFVTGYKAGPECHRSSGFVSTEILFVDVARYLTRPFTGRYWFDIRASAALHLLVLAVAMGLLLSVTRRATATVRFLLPPLAILMFTDVEYVAWLNSAYMDNASWVLLLLIAAIGATDANWTSAAYAITGVLLIFSKSQHAMLGIPFAAFAVFRTPRKWLYAASSLLFAAFIMPAFTSEEYTAISLFNLVFSRLAPKDHSVLTELNLPPDYEKWIGTNAFSHGSPVGSPDWRGDFLSRISFGSVAIFYLHHPGVAIRELNHELHDSVHSMRPSYMANYRREDGFPPHNVATHFSFWSNLRMDLLTRYPYHLLVLYALPFIAAVFCAVRHVRIRHLPLACTLAAAGICEFGLCTLADGIDTHRHLFLFQVITETVILMTVAAVLSGRSIASAELP